MAAAAARRKEQRGKRQPPTLLPPLPMDRPARSPAATVPLHSSPLTDRRRAREAGFVNHGSGGGRADWPSNNQHNNHASPPARLPLLPTLCPLRPRPTDYSFTIFTFDSPAARPGSLAHLRRTITTTLERLAGPARWSSGWSVGSLGWFAVARAGRGLAAGNGRRAGAAP